MNMTIEELEAYLLDHYSNGGVDQSLFMKLAEEIGEVAEVLKKRIGLAANSKECSAFFLGDLQRCGVNSYYIKNFGIPSSICQSHPFPLLFINTWE